MAALDDSHYMKYFVPRRLASACYEGCQKWENSCGLYYCKVERINFFTKIFALICFGGTLTLVIIGNWNGLNILHNANSDTPAFRLMLQVLGGVVHVGIITGFVSHDLKSGNQWE